MTKSVGGGNRQDVFTWEQLFSRRQFLGLGAATVATAVVGPKILKAMGRAEAAPKAKAAAAGKYVHTLCEMCVYRCGVKALVVDGVAVKLEGNPNHSGSRGKLCPRGNAGLQVLYDPDRLKFPIIRAGERGSGLWRKASWDEALDYVAGEMQRIKDQYGPEAMIFSSTHGLSQHYFENLFKAYGSPNYGTQRSLCFNAMTMAFGITYGVEQPGTDYKRCKYIIYSGRNVAEAISNGETQDFIDMASRGGKIVILDPRFTKSAAKATEWIPIKPGADLAFYLAMADVIINENLYNASFVADYTVGFEEFQQEIQAYTPEWAETKCQVPARTIRRIAHEFAAAAPSAVVHRNWRTSNFINSFQTERAIAVLNALIGNWNTPGGLKGGGREGEGLGSLPQPPYPAISALRLDGVPWKYPLVPLKYGIFQTLRDAILTGEPYQARGWLIARQNPLQALPDRKKTIEALMNMELVVTIDTMPNDTSYYADVILPESTYLERYDPLLPVGNRVFIRQPVVEPLYDTKSGLEIYRELGARLGLEDYFPYKDPVEVLAAQVAPFSVSLEEVKEKGHFDLPEVKHAPDASQPASPAWQTLSGKVEIASSYLAQVGEKAVPYWQEPAEPPAGQFYLLSGKVAQHTQMGTQNNRWLSELFPENAAWINNQVAAEKGIRDGDEVVIESSVGKVRIMAFVTEGIRPDCIFMVPGYGHISKGLTETYGRGACDSALHETYTDPVSGSQALSQTFVTLEKA